jgi:hypothetical protein
VTGGASANDTQHEASVMVKATLLTSSQPHRSPAPFAAQWRSRPGGSRGCARTGTGTRSSRMSVFSEAEIAYLQRKTMGRLATIGSDGMPHLVPLT